MRLGMLSNCALSAMAIAGMIFFSGCGGGGGGDNGGGNGGQPGGPVINSLNAADDTIWPGEETAVTASASHPQGQSLTYIWSTNGGEISGSGEQVTWTAPVPGGAFTVTLRVRDTGGREVSRQLTITAGATVTGRVVDTRTGEPLGGAELRIDRATGTTGADGRFSIAGVGRGSHPIEFLNFDFVPAGPEIIVDVNEPASTVTVAQDIPASDLGGAPPPPPFDFN